MVLILFFQTVYILLRDTLVNNIIGSKAGTMFKITWFATCSENVIFCGQTLIQIENAEFDTIAQRRPNVFITHCKA